jgi:hypothetical protein
MHHQLVKGIITLFTVIFKNWHHNPPNLLGFRWKYNYSIVSRQGGAVDERAGDSRGSDAGTRRRGDAAISDLGFGIWDLGFRIADCEIPILTLPCAKCVVIDYCLLSPGYLELL